MMVIRIIVTELFLASQSPRRAELLCQIGIDFEVVGVEVPEMPEVGEAPVRYVSRVAMAKAEAGRRCHQGTELPVLGADTSVVLDNTILGKPNSEEEACAFLTRLSGGRHQVMTAVAVVGHHCNSLVSITDVVFRTLNSREIHKYVASGEPMDKAGAYGIQGLGGVFAASINGSYSGVVGLPVFETAQLLVPYGLPRHLQAD